MVSQHQIARGMNERNETPRPFYRNHSALDTSKSEPGADFFQMRR